MPKDNTPASMEADGMAPLKEKGNSKSTFPLETGSFLLPCECSSPGDGRRRRPIGDLWDKPMSCPCRPFIEQATLVVVAVVVVYFDGLCV